jgi:hypothetical protein
MNIYPMSAIDLSFLFGRGNGEAIGWIPAKGNGTHGSGNNFGIDYKAGRITPISVWEEPHPYFDTRIESYEGCSMDDVLEDYWNKKLRLLWSN